MGAMKRELERLAEIVIYGTPETMTREMDKVAGLADGGAVAVLAYAVEMAREITPLCECGADYFADLYAKYPQIVEHTNRKTDNA
jgi:c-di-GMP-related signal transduction protein